MKYRPRLTLARAHALAALLLLLAAAPRAFAQGEHFEPYVLTPGQTAVRVWSSGDHTFARVNITFADGSYAIDSVSPVTREGNDLSVDFTTSRWTGASTQAVVVKESFFDLGALAPGTAYTFTVKSRGNAVRAVTFDPALIAEHWEEASAPEGTSFAVRTAGGVTFAAVAINFPDDGYRVVEWK